MAKTLQIWKISKILLYFCEWYLPIIQNPQLLWELTYMLGHCDYRKRGSFNASLNHVQQLLNHCKDRTLGQVKLGMVMENFVAHYVLYDSTALLSMDIDLLYDLIAITADQNPVFGSLLVSKKAPKAMYSLETSPALRRYW